MSIINVWSIVQWWDEWQMRILMAGSLLMQWFLLLAAPMRKYTIRTCLRWLIWLAYISCDALAIYALATLFNRQTKASSPCHAAGVKKASSLEVLWAPVLLIHLGGREEITAYNIEDNEMWTRHTVTLVSQVTIALYTFYKTWPDSGDRRLLWSAVLLFVIGIISFCEKPWALRRASINRLVYVYSSLAAGERKKPASWWEYLFTELGFGGKYKYLVGVKDNPGGPILSEGDKVQMILSDMSLGAAAKAQQRLGKPAADILVTGVVGAERDIKPWLRRAFGLIYTRANVVSTPAYLACHLLLLPSLHVAAFALFAASDKQAYRQFDAADVKMTYVILSFTAVLDVLGVPISELLYWVLSKTTLPALCETLPGDNLIDAVRKTKRPVAGPLIRLSKAAGWRWQFFHRDDRHNLYGQVAGFVVAELFASRKVQTGLDLSSYRNTVKKTNWALGKLPVLFNADGTAANVDYEPIWKSLRALPFDESVLRWHIATDLCCRLSPPPRGLDALTYTHSKCAAGISNYMAHLLNCHPDMLMTGSRQHLFSEALRSMGLVGRVVWTCIDDAKDACTKSKGSVIDEAWCLANVLTTKLGDKERWELMYRVWVGLLCYSASMCRGYQHAKSLGEGGEFLSFVWLVIALKGAKTLADKLQMPDGVEDGAKEEEAEEGMNLSTLKL